MILLYLFLFASLIFLTLKTFQETPKTILYSYEPTSFKYNQENEIPVSELMTSLFSKEYQK